MPQENKERNLIGFLQKKHRETVWEEARVRFISTLSDLYEPPEILSRRKRTRNGLRHKGVLRQGVRSENGHFLLRFGRIEVGILYRGQLPVDAALIEKDSQQQPGVGNDGQHGKKRLEIAQRAKDQHGQPVQEDDGARMELQGKVAMTPDHRQTAQIPAVECGEGMEPQQGMADFRGIIAGEGKQNVGNAADRGYQRKRMPEVRYAFCCSWIPSYQ